MRTIDGGDGNPWICRSPSEFDKAMRRTHSNLKTSSHHMWDSINVTRDNQELGSLGLLRQCLELWECEMEKWGCNGLGEKLDDKLLVHAHIFFFTTRLTRTS